MARVATPAGERSTARIALSFNPRNLSFRPNSSRAERETKNENES